MTEDDDSPDTESGTSTEKDIFGLKKMSTNQEVIVSLTLFTIGALLVASQMLPLVGVIDIAPGMLGLVMMGAGYLFGIESIRELEEKDHFLARKLERKAD